MTHRGALIDYATPITGCRMRAEDLVQEAYMRFATVEKTDHPVAYLYRIVRNLAFDWKRHDAAEKRRDQAHLLMVGAEQMAPSPQEEALYRDELREVRAALAELPDGMRRAFEMHRLGGLSFQQIAQQLDVSIATAARWAQQALLHITKRLRDSQ